MKYSQREFSPKLSKRNPSDERGDLIFKIIDSINEAHAQGYKAPRMIKLPEGVSMRRDKYPFENNVKFSWWSTLSNGSRSYDEITLWHVKEYTVEAINEKANEDRKRYQYTFAPHEIDYTLSRELEKTTNRELTPKEYREQIAENCRALHYYLENEIRELARVDALNDLENSHQLSFFIDGVQIPRI